MKFLTFALVILAALFAVSSAEDATCSPWLGYCQQTSDCCRHLVCMSYNAKCVPQGGLIVPGQDTRPLGPGPYPPKGAIF